MTRPLAPGDTLGIIGGGQLGRMLSQAASRLGFNVVILDPEENSPACRVSQGQIVAAYDNPTALRVMAGACQAVTFEFENVPARSIEILTEAGTVVAPGPRALAVAQDRVDEKTFLNSLGVPTTAFAAIDDLSALRAAVASLGAPALLKTRRQGYDGKGQVWIKDAAGAARAWAAIGSQPAILEAKAEFARELSVICARGRDGSIAIYPLGENTHAGGVLKTTVAPAKVTSQTKSQATRIARKILEGLDYVGVMGVELFEMRGGRLLVNEIAPRVHNSGHWTQDGCVCDQFEQHVRAVAGWPLGPTAAHAQVEMTNLLGNEIKGWKALAADPAVRMHVYGKREAKPGRKMAHVNRMKPLRRGPGRKS
ncbi:5-(carboxyamino)imidazole ribonucleotide synthase [Brevundimonas aveniformis]|uniref:5-(carboxyamino)imidazole ribonucleotide synthase n=1 Tax=Brevundimonas aveniformis TaxID=370977 RepID=UPI003CD0C867